MDYSLDEIKFMAMHALWQDQPALSERLKESGDSLMALSGHLEGTTLWVIVSTPGLGEVGRYTADELLTRHEAYLGDCE